MRKIKTAVPVLLGALTLAGVVSPAVRAAETEGPLLLVENQLLGSGETQEVKGSAKTAFTFKSASVKAKVECKALKLKSGATVIGSARKLAGRVKRRSNSPNATAAQKKKR